ncbi:MAG TPA: cupin domain-containing protein [Caulobacteraceae bacterium]|nr:cupin domain-containing protein [Caulobacteraceae bacterium]
MRTRGGELPWIDSPAAGVQRRMLFRIGDEQARATSIVRYAPGSRFARHTHTGGEEFIVLEGTFQDETGDFPAGTYVRNPPGTSHAPASAEGCTILVKLWQFRCDDDVRTVVRPGEGAALELAPGVDAARLLFEGAGERVTVEDWRPDAAFNLNSQDGLELFVLEGSFNDGQESLDRWCWLRLPPGQILPVRVGAQGARVWMKRGPVLHDDVCRFDNGAAPQ